jgi:hypothetical protein
MARKLRPHEESEFNGDAPLLDPFFEAELFHEFTRVGDALGGRSPDLPPDPSSIPESPSDENPEKSG